MDLGSGQEARHLACYSLGSCTRLEPSSSFCSLCFQCIRLHPLSDSESEINDIMEKKADSRVPSNRAGSKVPSDFRANRSGKSHSAVQSDPSGGGAQIKFSSKANQALEPSTREISWEEVRQSGVWSWSYQQFFLIRLLNIISEKMLGWYLMV